MGENERILSEYRRRDTNPYYDKLYDTRRPGPRAVLWSRQEGFKRFLLRERLELSKIESFLDVGCGGGGWIPIFSSYGLKVGSYLGVDLVPERIERAQSDYPEYRFQVSPGNSLPAKDGTLDVAFQSMALSSIVSDHTRSEMLKEMWRVLKPGGLLISYDMRWVRRSPHLKRVTARDVLNGLELKNGTFASHSSTVLPPLMRIGALFPGLPRLLDAVPILHSHLFIAVRKNAA